MSFYQTNNSSIVRFIVHDPAQRVIAPFQSLQRVVQMQNVGQGYSGYYTGAVAGTVGVTNKSWLRKTSPMNSCFHLATHFSYRSKILICQFLSLYFYVVE